MPFVPAVLRTASTHCTHRSLNVPTSRKVANRVFLIRITPLHFVPLHSAHSFTHCLHLLAGSQGGLCESGARSNASTVSCSRSRSGRRKAREQSNCHTLRFVHLPVSAGGPIVAVSTLFAEAAKVLPRAVNWSLKNNVSSAGVAT